MSVSSVRWQRGCSLDYASSGEPQFRQAERIILREAVTVDLATRNLNNAIGRNGGAAAR